MHELPPEICTNRNRIPPIRQLISSPESEITRLKQSSMNNFEFFRRFQRLVGIYSIKTIDTMDYTKNYKRTCREMPEYVKEKLRNNANLHKPKTPETKAKISAGQKRAWAAIPPKNGTSTDAGGTTITDIMLENDKTDVR